ARARGLTLDPIDNFLAHPGGGITAHVGVPGAAATQEQIAEHPTPDLPPPPTGPRLIVGTRRLLEEQGVFITPEAADALERCDAAGETTLLVARDGIILGVIGARDRVRPDAAAVLAELRALGINDIALLTGDRSAAARAVAEALGISEVHAE